MSLAVRHKVRQRFRQSAGTAALRGGRFHLAGGRTCKRTAYLKDCGAIACDDRPWAGLRRPAVVYVRLGAG